MPCNVSVKSKLQHAPPPPGHTRAFDTFAVPGRREFDYQSLPNSPLFSSRCAVFFVAVLNSSSKPLFLMFVVTIFCDTDPVVARKVARKYENLRLNSLRDVLSNNVLALAAC